MDNMNNPAPVTHSQPASLAVGVDGGPASLHALEWALNSPASWGPVTPIAAWDVSMWRQVLAGSAAPVAFLAEEINVTDMTDHLLTQIEPVLRDRLTEPVIARGSAADVLTDAAKHNGTLVVGTRSQGAVADTVLGSVSIDCASRATGPVIVVPEIGGDRAGPVVVGIDGSENSLAALRWALANVDADVPIIAFGVWTYVIHGAWQELPTYDDRTEADTMEIVGKVVAAATESAGMPADRVQLRIGRGDPRRALHEMATTARMLVLGASCVTGWQHALLGSVTTALLHRPAAPTVVVPATPRG